MSTGHAVYRERTWAPAWVLVLLGLACLASLGPSLYFAYGQAVPGQPADDMSTRGFGMLAGGLAIVYGLAFSTFSCLNVEVRSDHLFIWFGPLRLIRKRIRYGDVRGVSAVTYRPFREFGGWGIRWRPGKSAWSIRGNQAVSVDLRNGKVVYVGSRFPQRLAGRIEVAMRVR
ncbi:MAG: hypothetical protein OXQ94_05455 [Gemmatimonadota bacterium]|nr:hypothetical protein [Gemmatimonadota bacterium]MDE2871123.1 hypothetical protein [Gemmatimonadota bacterium]